jgi:AcrR family transcriptional regulator
MSRDTPRTRLEPADRRRELLVVAERLAATDGIGSLSTQAGAPAAGASKALVFHYFGSVVGLQRAVVSAAVDDLLAALAATEGPVSPERPVVVLDAFITTVTARRELWTDIWRGALHDDPQTQEILADARSLLVERLARRSTAVHASSTSPTPDAAGDQRLSPDALALLSRGWVALAENTTAAWLAGSPLTQHELRDLLVRTLSAVLGDLAGPLPR